MKKLNNRLILTTIVTLFSTIILLPSVSYAQPLNQVRAFLAPASQQGTYFPSEQQIQQALLTPTTKQKSSFVPLEQEPQVFINQFTTPDVPRVKQNRLFFAPTQAFNNTPNTPNNTITMPQQYKVANGGYQQPTMKFPAAPRSLNKNNHFASNNNSNPFSFPNTFPMMPFPNNNGTNINNGFPFMPNTNSHKKKAWGDTRNIWPDFYTDFTDTAWDQAISSPRKLGRMPGGWRFPYISTPDPVTVSDAITNQFPPIAEEAGHMANLSKWDIFDGQ